MIPSMRISASGLAFIADREGFVDHVYHDVAGIPTIGFGHVMRHGDPTSVTRDQAMVMLRHDVASAESAVNHDVTHALDQNQFDALVSFSFNCGTGALATSSLLEQVNAGNTRQAAKDFLPWCHARVGGRLVVVQALLNRRIAEAIMFLGMSDADARVVLGLPASPDETIRPGVETVAAEQPVTASDVVPVASETTQPTLPEDLET
jgi:lysozyme